METPAAFPQSLVYAKLHYKDSQKLDWMEV